MQRVELMQANEALLQTNKKLEQSEGRLWRMYQDHSSIMLVIDPETTNIIDANRAATDFYGWSTEELKQMNIGQINTLAQTKTRENFDALKKTKHNQYLFSHRRKDGSIRNVEVYSNAIVYDDKEMFFSIINDITPRIRAEELIRKSEELFKTLFHKHSAIQALVDPVTGKILDINQAGSDWYGWSIEELRQKHVGEINLLTPEAVRSSLSSVINEQCNRFSGYHKRADGSIRDVEISRNKIEIDGQAVIHVIIHDITDRKQAEEALRESNERFEAIIDAIQVGTWEWNVVTNECIVNDRWFEIKGYSRQELSPVNLQTLQDLAHPDDYQHIVEILEQHFNGELEDFICEYRVKHKNGQWIWLLDRGKVVTRTLDGKPIRMLGTNTDITVSKVAEIELQNILIELSVAKEKAEENDRLKTAFLANISHEIRTPMNGILGFAELLKEPHLSGEELAEYIDLIQQSGKRMMNLISDILDISRLDAKETTVKITETPLNKLLLDLQTQFRLEAQKKGLRLTCCNGLADSESLIQTDAQKLSQILANLIQNAIKFTSTGGIDFGYTKKENMLEFYCVDSGIGIPANKHKKIFDRFHQLNNSLTRNHEGSGLGLSISKSFVELLGGTINVQSIEGAGTTFTVTLPHNPVTSDQLPTALLHAHCPQTTACCILIVEDDEVSTILLNKILQSETLTLLYAVNGWEAVELVRHHPEINLVLMDIKMPGMNGYEATKEIKKFRPDLPVIAQTAFASKEEQQKGEVAGCDAFITKPINKTDLLNLIQSLLNY